MADIDRLIGFMAIMQVPFMNDPDALMYIEEVKNALKELKAHEHGWISVEDGLPVETHSIFWPWYGKKEWSKAMWREQSDKVLVTVKFKDGSEIVTTGETHDGAWRTTVSRTLEPVVSHWMPLPEPAKEG